MLERILERVSVIPSKPQLKELIDLIADKLNAGLEVSSNAIEKRLKLIVDTASNVLAEMSKEFKKDMKDLLKDIVENLKQRDVIYFKHIQDHKEVIFAIQQSNKNIIKALTDKVFELNSSLSEFKNMVLQQMNCTDDALTRTDNVMALVHEQMEQAEAKL